MSNRNRGRTPVPTAIAPRAPTSGAVSDPAGGTLAARPERLAANRVTIERAPQDPPEHLFRRLLSAYLAGAGAFEVIEHPRLSPTSHEVIREFVRRTRRPQRTLEEPDRVVLEDREDCSADLLDERLRHLGEMVLRFHREAEESWGRLTFGGDGLWEARDDEVDREAWYLERCIALGERQGTTCSRPATGAWTVARSLERVGDHAVTLGELGSRLAHLGSNGDLVRELRQFHAQALTHLEEVLADPEGVRANDLLDVGEALINSGRTLAERLLPAVGDGSMPPANAAAVARALEAIVRTVAYSQDIAQAYFDRSARSIRARPVTSSGALAVNALS